MIGTLTQEDKAAIDAWSPEPRRRHGLLRAAGTAVLIAVVVVAGLAGGDTGASLSDELPGSSRRQVRRLRRGRPVTALLWYREQGSATPSGPFAVQVRSDYTCLLQPGATTLDLRETQLVDLGQYSGPSPNRFEPIPTGAFAARLRQRPRAGL